MKKYQVVVRNIGHVYDGNSGKQARAAYSEYVAQSKTGYGRAAGECVTLLYKNEIIAECFGSIESDA